METESTASGTGLGGGEGEGRGGAGAGAGAGGGGGGGGGTGVAVTEVALTQTMRSEEPKLLPAPAAAPLAPAAAAPAPASATTTTTTPPAEDHAIDATTYGIQQQQQQPTMMGAEQQPQPPTLQQKQQLVQAQPLMLKVTVAKDKEKSHKRKKNMDSTGQGPPPTAVVKAENTPDVSAAAVTGDLRDEDDDNDEDDDRLLMQEYDPERLKAFNMFVRLFVDENLDRVAPISKQPKEKIQAILEACDRQFPEFHHRSRKRIRTYLKSCRRMRRSKGVNDGKQIRPTLPHLTSAAAETILARACENESNNAKRMRMGLEPLPATEMVMASGQAPIPALPPPPPPPAPAAPTATTAAPPTAPQPMPNPKSSPRSKMSLSPHSSAAAITPGIPLPLQKPLELTTQTGCRASPLAHAQPKPAPQMPLEMAHSSPMRQPSPKVAHRPVEQDHVLMQSATLRGALPESELPLAYVTNGSGAKAHVGHTFESEIHPFQNEAYPGSTSSVLQSNDQQQNGPTDLSMKKETAPLSKSHLNPEEVATIKQLIAGYRESAAFLCRSADELQQLIMQHN